MVTLEHRGLPWPWMILPLQSKYNKQMQCIASHHPFRFISLSFKFLLLSVILSYSPFGLSK